MLLRSRAKLRVGYPWWLRPWLARNVVAITLGRRIYILPRYMQKPPAEISRLIRHELAHVRQVERHGLLGFLVRYVAEFFGHLRRERSFDTAYRKISFEIEAAAAEEAADDL
ncbi:MAG: hypothetical protein QOH21_3050 [Acidobacteriota bacterium]|nr:hypothetical protein [Acidobacteriota bacterium]